MKKKKEVSWDPKVNRISDKRNFDEVRPSEGGDEGNVTLEEDGNISDTDGQELFENMNEPHHRDPSMGRKNTGAEGIQINNARSPG